MSAQNTASSNDLSIKSVVDAIQPPAHELRAAMLQDLDDYGYCKASFKHIYNISYGKTNFDSVGLAFHVCPAQGSQPCKLHLRPLAARPSEESLLGLYEWLSTLEPPPYGKLVNRASAIKLREQMRDRLEGRVSDPTGTSRIPRIPSAARLSQGSSPAKASQGSSPAKASQASSAGRPRNETVRVPLLVYIVNGVEPVRMTIEGIVRDSLVEVVFKQPHVWSRLGLDPSSRDKSADFHRWSWMLGGWTPYPRPHTPHFILPGETLLYRETDVTRPWKLDFYTSQLLPVTFYPRLRMLLEQVGENAPVAGPSSASRACSSTSTPSKLAAHPAILFGNAETPKKRAAEPAVATSSSSKRRKSAASSQTGNDFALPAMQRNGKGHAPPPGAEIIEVSDDEDDLGHNLAEHVDRKGKGKATDVFPDLDLSED